MNDIDDPVDDRLRDAIRALANGIEPSSRAWADIDRRVTTVREPKTTPWRLALLGLACVAIAVSIPAALLLTRVMRRRSVTTRARRCPGSCGSAGSPQPSLRASDARST